ncbi:protease modulator HflC [bacterium]|nr:protease modulator HflC [candidate division CSSED10-310 bacterium]
MTVTTFRLFACLSGLAILVLGFSCFAVVTIGEHAVITTFGDPVRSISEPGLYLKWPYPVQTMTRIDARLLLLDPEEMEFLTSDKKNVLVNTFMCWRVADGLRFIESVGDRSEADKRLSDLLFSEVGGVLGNREFSSLVSTEQGAVQIDAMMAEVTNKCRATARTEFGIQVVDVRIKRLNFPEQNKASVFNRMRAERERIATRYRSEGEEQATMIKADAERESRELLATAREDAEKVRGRADAEATRIYAESYGQDPEFYRFWETLRTYEEILTTRTTVVVPGDSPLTKVLYNGPPEAGDE